MYSAPFHKKFLLSVSKLVLIETYMLGTLICKITIKLLET